jgi:sugar/nucleoside kinase (ribokinase family)
MYDLITVGDSLIDIFLVLDDGDTNCLLNAKKKQLCFNYADKICILNSTHSVGGNAANVAIGAAKLGLKTAIRTEVGDDLNGQAIEQTFDEFGVDTSLLKMHKNKETRYSVVLNYLAERTILSYHAPRKYSLPKLPKTNWIYYTSMGESFEGVQTKLIAYLKKNPATKLAMNPGSYQFKNGLPKIRQMLKFADVLLVNKEEAEKLVGKKGAVKSLFKPLHKFGAKIVVITDSMNGSFVSDGENRLMLKPYPIKPVAKTGAGDAYTSGFLSALVSGRTVEDAMQWGTANAGCVVREFGAQRGLCTKRGVQEVVKKYKNNKPKAY